MSAVSTKENREACDRLISQIHLMKLRLEAKHGPAIKQKWARKDRNDPAYELAI